MAVRHSLPGPNLESWMSKGTKEPLVRRDEYNRAQMGMIAAVKEWDRKEHRVVLLQGNRRRVMHAKSTEVLSVGQDSDIMIAITSLFYDAGCPPDNLLVTTPYAIITRAKLPTNGRIYHRVYASLRRLRAGMYTFRDGYWNASRKRWMNAVDDFQFIVRLRLRDTEDLTGEEELEADAPILLELSSQFAEQIRQGYVRSVDEQLLAQLKQPTNRSIYHFLDSNAVDPETGKRAVSLDYRLGDLYSILGLTGRPDSNLDRLKRMYRPLLEYRYLADVTCPGSGEDSRVTFIFGSNAREADPALVEALRAEGVVLGVARSLALNYPERVLPSIAYVRRYHQQVKRVQSKGALLHDVIKNPEKYELEVRTIDAPSPPPAVPPVQPAPDDDQDLQREQARFEALSPAQRAEALQKKLALFGVTVSSQQAELLCQSARDAFDLGREVVRAAAHRQNPEAVVEAALRLSRPA